MKIGVMIKKIYYYVTYCVMIMVYDVTKGFIVKNICIRN